MLKSFTNELRAAIYIRVSTSKQVKEGFGLDFQKHRCQIMAKMKDWPVVKVYSDEGISGTLDGKSRPGLNTLLEDAKNKVFDVLIFYSLDRIGRTTSIVLKTIDQLTAIGIKIISCKESIDTSSPTGVFVLTIFAALAQLERTTIINRMVGGKLERIKKDGESGGRIPYGYIRIDGKVRINTDESIVVNNIFYGYCVSRISMSEIARILNKNKIPYRNGKEWNPNNIYTAIKNRDKYEGGFRNNSPIRWPRILTHDYPKIK